MSRTADDSGDISGYEAMLKLLELEPRPDGVFCYNDPTALGAMKAILDAGLRVPEDIAIVGCGNVIYDTLLRVPLSSVDQDSLAIGENAGNLALSLVGLKTAPPPKSMLLDPSLVVRASSRRTS
jgi:LacI family transcriptional regulator